MKNICVYLGSNYGARPEYAEAACRLAQTLAERKLTLVYGASERGLMKEIADIILGHKGRAIGVIPEKIQHVAHKGLTKLYVVKDMHERKAKMAELADAFIALPGSYGTLDELFGILATAKLNFHKKPIGLLNVQGYYDDLLSFLDRTVIDGFSRKEHRNMVLSSNSPDDLLDQFLTYQHVEVSPWFEKSEIEG